MICVRCKNEKWNEDICPNCGLDNKAALLIQAEKVKADGNITSAIALFDKYLLEDSNNLEVLGKRGICLCLEAVSLQDEKIFQRADNDLNAVFEKNWNWERGHLARVELYFGFGKEDQLQKEYAGFSVKNDFRKPLCLELIRIITLTKKFKENPPASLTDQSLAENAMMLKSFWPAFLGIPILLWIALKISSLPYAREGGNVVILFFVFGFIVTSIIMLVYLCMRMYKKNRSMPKDGRDFVAPN